MKWKSACEAVAIVFQLFICFSFQTNQKSRFDLLSNRKTCNKIVPNRLCDAAKFRLRGGHQTLIVEDVSSKESLLDDGKIDLNSDEGENIYPITKANLISKLFFLWTSSLMKRGNAKILETEDLWKLPQNKKIGQLANKFEMLMEQSKKKSRQHNQTSDLFKSPLMRALFGIFWRDFIRVGILRLFNTMVQFGPALLVRRVLISIEVLASGGEAAALKRAYNSAIALFAIVTTKTLLENQYFYGTNEMSIGVRATLSAAVYRKSLRLSAGARQNSTIGEIINLMQLDANRVETLVSSLHPLWDSIFQILGYSLLLFHILGPSAFAGFLVMASLIPINTQFFKRLSNFRQQMLKQTDLRVKNVNEMLQGIRAIKFYGWEMPFKEKIEGIHNKELDILVKSVALRSALVSVLTATPAFVIVVTLGLYSRLGNTLSASKVFTALALFNQLRFPLYFFPVTLNSLADGKVSVNRLMRFFLEEEVTPYVQRVNKAPLEYPQSTKISVKSGAFYWTDEPSNGEPTTEDDAVKIRSSVIPALHGINFSAAKGELVAVIGPVGSGKSSLLSSLLGEMIHISGEVYVEGSIAYVPQSAWIPNDTIRGNILFGKPFEREKYERVLKASNMEKDLFLFEHSDLTEIGEQGINLSGGQKQRLSIARALYSDSDLYLFDDPLSALDAQVAQNVFRECVTVTLKGKTRILVTNQLQFLPECDKIVIMGDRPNSPGNTILDQGSYNELISRGHDLSTFIESNIEKTPTKMYNENEILVHKIKEDSYKQAKQVGSVASSVLGEETYSDSVDLSFEDSNCRKQAGEEKTESERAGREMHERGKVNRGRLIQSEERAVGAVGWDIYRSYFKSAGSPALIGFVLLLFSSSSLFIQLQQWVVSFWTSDPTYVNHTLGFYLGGVTLSAVLVSIVVNVRTVISYMLGVKASRFMHQNMLHRVLHAPISFFDTTPVGRLVQRFSKDTDEVDQQLISQITSLISAVLNMVGSFSAIVIATPLFAAIVLPLSTLYIRIMNYFRPVARELQRLDSLTKSPVYAHFSETLGGLSCIRAFESVGRFTKINEKLLETNFRAYLSKKVIDRWLNVRLELMGNTAVLLATLLSARAAGMGKLQAGLAGLAITNALSVTSLLNWAVRCYIETETMMNSVQRVLFMSNIKQEAPHWIERPKNPAIKTDEFSKENESTHLTVASQEKGPDDSLLLKTGWPWEGSIEFKNCRMRYRKDTGLILKGIDLVINPGEKVGIVGRTGSGKSSLLQILFRMVELEAGKILIDGVDIGSIGLSALRSRLTIIPQDPVLFSGTLRSNLDPFDSYSDTEIWDSLRASGLEDTIAGFKNGLSEMVSEYGENFSVGQRQLICLSRALLRRSRVLLLDEATSSVDYETDALIQRTIRSAFKDCTVLTIAHRLNTIMDSDRILVLEGGRVAELGTPNELLSDEKGHFYKLLSTERNI